jgi:hypothetical protein
VRCENVWVADGTVAGTTIRIEAAGVEPEEVVLMEVPEHLRRKRPAK